MMDRDTDKNLQLLIANIINHQRNITLIRKDVIIEQKPMECQDENNVHH